MLHLIQLVHCCFCPVEAGCNSCLGPDYGIALGVLPCTAHPHAFGTTTRSSLLLPIFGSILESFGCCICTAECWTLGYGTAFDLRAHPLAAGALASNAESLI